MIQTTRRDAKSASGHFAPLFLLCYVAIAGQTHGAAQGQPAPAPAPQAPATDTVAPDIPGVVKGGTKVEVVKQGFRATDGPVPLPDGSLIFWNFPDKTIVKIDRSGNASTFLTQGVGVGRNGAQAMTFDSKGRLITLDKDKTSTRIAVVYPPGSEKVLVDTCDGKPMPEANDVVADKKGGVYFSDQDGFVFYGRPDGTCVKVQTETDRLNGIILSRDEKTLYVTTQGRTPREALTDADLKTDGGDTLLAFEHSAGRHAAQPPRLRQVRIHQPATGRTSRSAIRRGRHHDRQPGTSLRHHCRRHSGLQPARQAPGHDSGFQESAEPGLCGPGQEDALRHRPRRHLQDRDALAGVQRQAEVEQSSSGLSSAISCVRPFSTATDWEQLTAEN